VKDELRVHTEGKWGITINIVMIIARPEENTCINYYCPEHVCAN
jgi:hypothetical protein